VFGLRAVEANQVIERLLSKQVSLQGNQREIAPARKVLPDTLNANLSLGVNL
jgi:hypothetical protein